MAEKATANYCPEITVRYYLNTGWDIPPPSDIKDDMKRVLCLACALLIAPLLQGYSVLTHEAIIDSAWDQNIKPLLLKRFPDATPDDLLHAHAYSYGGCIIQDM